MKRITILFFLNSIFLNAFSQDVNLQFKLDSIIKVEKTVKLTTQFQTKLTTYFGAN